MRRFLEEARLMVADIDVDVTLNSTRIDFIWRVAYQSLVEGLRVSSAYYSSGCYKYTCSAVCCCAVCVW